MSITVKNVLTVPYRVVGNQKKVVKDCTFDSSYLENGEPLTPAELGLNVIEYASANLIHGSEEATVRPTNAEYKEEKLHLIDSATGKEVASTKNMEKVVVRVEAYGT